MILFMIFKYHELIRSLFDKIWKDLERYKLIRKKPTREIVISAPTTIKKLITIHFGSIDFL